MRDSEGVKPSYTSASTKALQQLQEDEKTPEVQKVLGAAVRRSRGEMVEGYASMYWTFFTDYAY